MISWWWVIPFTVVGFLFGYEIRDWISDWRDGRGDL